MHTLHFVLHVRKFFFGQRFPKSVVSRHVVDILLKFLRKLRTCLQFLILCVESDESDIGRHWCREVPGSLQIVRRTFVDSFSFIPYNSRITITSASITFSHTISTHRITPITCAPYNYVELKSVMILFIADFHQATALRFPWSEVAEGFERRNWTSAPILSSSAGYSIRS